MPIHDWSRVPGAVFHSFHNGWIHAISDALNDGVLPPGYHALGERRIAGIEPDVLAFRGPAKSGTGGDAPAGPGSPAGSGGGGLSLAVRPPAVSLVERGDPAAEADREAVVTVRAAADRGVVAVIEVASPGNKDRRRRLDAFLGKNVGLIAAGVHLLLVDLHPPGPLDPGGPHPALWERLTGRDRAAGNGAAAAVLTQASYLAGDPPRAFVEPARVGGELTDMPLFLTADLYVEVPLGATYAERVRRLPGPYRDDLTA